MLNLFTITRISFVMCCFVWLLSPQSTSVAAELSDTPEFAAVIKEFGTAEALSTITEKVTDIEPLSRCRTFTLLMMTLADKNKWEFESETKTLHARILAISTIVGEQKGWKDDLEKRFSSDVDAIKSNDDLVEASKFCAEYIDALMGVSASTSNGEVGDASSSAEKDVCDTSRVTASISRKWMEYDFFKMTYTVSHSCTKAVGVQLRAVGYYKDGSIAFSKEFWPGSTSNIPPNNPMPDEFLTSVVAPIEKIELTPIAINEW